MSLAARCKKAYLRTSLHLARVRVDSAFMNTSGTVTPVAPQPVTGPLTGLPSFCDGAITQTDSAGDHIHIDVWLPASWNGRSQGVGGSEYSCGPYYYEMAPAIEAAFARLFLAPGAQHCASGAGPGPAEPAQPMASLVNWVEKGKAPSTIPGSVTSPVTNVATAAQPLCRYPLVSRYRGHGSTTVASSYTCNA